MKHIMQLILVLVACVTLSTGRVINNETVSAVYSTCQVGGQFIGLGDDVIVNKVKWRCTKDGFIALSCVPDGGRDMHVNTEVIDGKMVRSCKVRGYYVSYAEWPVGQDPIGFPSGIVIQSNRSQQVRALSANLTPLLTTRSPSPRTTRKLVIPKVNATASAKRNASAQAVTFAPPASTRKSEKPKTNKPGNSTLSATNKSRKTTVQATTTVVEATTSNTSLPPSTLASRLPSSSENNNATIASAAQTSASSQLSTSTTSTTNPQSTSASNPPTTPETPLTSGNTTTQPATSASSVASQAAASAETSASSQPITASTTSASVFPATSASSQPAAGDKTGAVVIFGVGAGQQIIYNTTAPTASSG